MDMPYIQISVRFMCLIIIAQRIRDCWLLQKKDVLVCLKEIAVRALLCLKEEEEKGSSIFSNKGT